MTKAQLENAAVSGLKLSGTAVARVTRSGTVVLRHVWPDDCDARVWDGIKSAAMRLAREVSRKQDTQVCVQHPDGTVIDYVEATFENYP